MGEQKNFAERVRRRYGGGIFSEMTVIYGNRRVTVRGCRKILSYAPEEICLELHGREICLRGRDLRCVSFTGGCVTVEGVLTDVALKEGRNDR